MCRIAKRRKLDPKSPRDQNVCEGSDIDRHDRRTPGSINPYSMFLLPIVPSPITCLDLLIRLACAVHVSTFVLVFNHIHIHFIFAHLSSGELLPKMLTCFFPYPPPPSPCRGEEGGETQKVAEDFISSQVFLPDPTTKRRSH